MQKKTDIVLILKGEKQMNDNEKSITTRKKRERICEIISDLIKGKLQLHIANDITNIVTDGLMRKDIVNFVPSADKLTQIIYDTLVDEHGIYLGQQYLDTIERVIKEQIL